MVDLVKMITFNVLLLYSVIKVANNIPQIVGYYVAINVLLYIGNVQFTERAIEVTRKFIGRLKPNNICQNLSSRSNFGLVISFCLLASGVFINQHTVTIALVLLLNIVTIYFAPSLVVCVFNQISLKGIN